MQAVEEGLYQGGDGSNFAYVVLSALAPKHLNIVRVKFGYRAADCQSSLYRLVDGQLHDEDTREWRALVDGLIPATSYNFIAYTEQARSRLSTSNNSTLTMTTQGETMVNITNLAARLSVYFVSQLEDIGFHNEAYTISGGVITLSGDYRLRHISLIPEAGTSDQLDQIVGGRNGDVVILSTDASYAITVSQAAGYIDLLASGATFLLEAGGANRMMLVSDDSSKFYEIARADNTT